MEKLPQKNNNESEFKVAIKQCQEDIKTIDGMMDECLKNIADFKNDLEEQKEHLQTIEEVIKTYGEMEEFGSNIFTQKDIDKVTVEIIKTKSVIDEINNNMSKFKELKFSLTQQMEAYKGLNDINKN